MTEGRRMSVVAPAANWRAGFTLLEVMLSLVIFSMLTAMVYSAFYIGHRAVVKGEREADINQRMRVAEDILGRQVRSAVRYKARHEDEQFPFFVGRADGMAFVSAAPQGRGGTGLAAITYRVTNGQLVLEERVGFTPDDLSHPPPDARIDRAVLLSGFESIKFEYLPHEEAEMGWQQSWDAREEDQMPAAVRVTVGGLEFFGTQPWVREIPLMIAYGWPPDDDFQDDDEDEDNETGTTSKTEAESEDDHDDDDEDE
jgi:prepilin-type N-terminal cleavage/methylation domain-containing protein